MTATPATMGPGSADLLSLAGKTALVTGAGGGIGSATAALLARSGARVLSVDLPGRDGPPGTETRPADLADPAALARLVEGDRDRGGRHVAVALDDREQAVGRDAGAGAGGLHDAGVGLVRDQQVDLVGPDLGAREGLRGRLAHRRDGVLEHRVALHVDGVGEGGDRLEGGRGA